MIVVIKCENLISRGPFENKVVDTFIRRQNEQTIYQDGNNCVLWRRDGQQIIPQICRT